MNKLAVITGGTKGIGKALVEKFASEGFDILTCSRKEADLESLKSTIYKLNKNVAVSTCVADLSAKSGRDALLKNYASLNRTADVLINNAGVFVLGQIHNEPEGVLENQIQTNLMSAYDISRGVVPGMIAKKKGTIFNICSTASIIPYVTGGSYCISKFALLGMTKVLREEMKEHNIRVTAVLPGATLTASWEGVDLPQERFMKPEDIANSIYGIYSLSDQTVVEELLLRPQLGDI
ncbi:SDR family oxidoreductase [Cytophaga aurantiaca]|uniref:SDR family oxidoreductase n=1 Tax=Cytophaga aurantiaca TaxID=29530 RepID=UPI00036214A2|nr:SDR family oxidoreductase [Cytophaga aurantiaca]